MKENNNQKIIDYFKGDELATNVFIQKYKQQSDETPDDMHKRMAKEFYRIEQKYQKNELRDLPSAIYPGATEVHKRNYKLSKYGQEREDLTEEKIYNFFKDFGKIIPQGSVMSQLGNSQIGSLSNCFVLGTPYDSYGGIMKIEEEMIQLMKRRGGVGIDLSTLRPAETPTTNAAKSSTGAVSFMHRFSHGTREVAQSGRRN